MTSLVDSSTLVVVALLMWILCPVNQQLSIYSVSLQLYMDNMKIALAGFDQPNMKQPIQTGPFMFLSSIPLVTITKLCTRELSKTLEPQNGRKYQQEAC